MINCTYFNEKCSIIEDCKHCLCYTEYEYDCPFMEEIDEN